MIIKRSGYHILRLSMAVTFLWIAILIFQSPVFWTGFIDSWFLQVLPFEALTLIYIVGVFDLLLGIAFLVDWKVHWAGLLSAVHMFNILMVTGIDEITVRDIAILGAGLTLLSETMPETWKSWLHKKAKPTGGKM